MSVQEDAVAGFLPRRDLKRGGLLQTRLTRSAKPPPEGSSEVWSGKFREVSAYSTALPERAFEAGYRFGYWPGYWPRPKRPEWKVTVDQIPRCFRKACNNLPVSP